MYVTTERLVIDPFWIRIALGRRRATQTTQEQIARLTIDRNTHLCAWKNREKSPQIQPYGNEPTETGGWPTLHSTTNVASGRVCLFNDLNLGIPAGAVDGRTFTYAPSSVRRVALSGWTISSEEQGSGSRWNHVNQRAAEIWRKSSIPPVCSLFSAASINWNQQLR